MNVDISNATYVAIQTGYTSRILNLIGKSPAILKDWVPNDEDNGETDNYKLLQNRGCLYIEDFFLEPILNPVGKDMYKIRKVRELMSQQKLGTDGYIVFSMDGIADAFNIASQLMKLGYCSFGPDDLFNMKYIVSNYTEFSVLVLRYDNNEGSQPDTEEKED